MVSGAEVVAFWREAGPERWFAKDDGFDGECRARFLGAWEAAARGELEGWGGTAEGALGLVILLDQMPRNIFRNDPCAWSSDALARAAAEAAIGKGFDRLVAPGLRAFFYLPFEHAEDLAAQERSVALFAALGDADSLKWARHHRDIVARFGRFPHRNSALGRESTPEELAFLAVDDFRG